MLLAAKLIVVAFFLRGQWNELPEPFLPFVPFLDDLGSPQTFRRTLQAVFLVAAVPLLTNRLVRTACIVLALVIFIALLSSHQYFENNRTLTACVLLLIGLYDRESRWPLVSYQLAVVYFGAALNKMLDSDWRSGQFVQHWISNVLNYEFYERLSAAFPGMMLSSLLGWTAIGWEYLLALGFVVRRLLPAAITGGVLYHTALLLITGRTYGMFYFTLLSAYLACVEWPRSPVEVRYPNAGAIRRGVWRVLRVADFDRLFQWSSAGVDVTSVTPHSPRAALEVTTNGETRRGAAAYRKLLAYTPLVYLVLLLAVHSLRRFAALYRAALRSFT